MFFSMLYGILKSSFALLQEMAPYLLLGFLVAGILHEFITTEKIARHLGKNNFASVIKAAVLGIPLPLCSCGVIPPTVALRKAGAGRAPVLSFLIATPTTGVDSIAATYSLMGPFFALYRVLASFIAAIFTGSLAGFLKLKEKDALPLNALQTAADSMAFSKRIFRVIHYGFVELISEISKWLIIGILIGGVITYFIPDDFFRQAGGNGLVNMLLMLLIAVPLYVCATGSIPIAAALMMKGLNPGAAFVFLLAGPATNSVTITVISKFLGKKTTAVYLSGIIVSSIVLGLGLDFIWNHYNLSASFLHHHHHALLPPTLSAISAAVILLLLLAAPLANRIKKREEPPIKEKGEMTSIFFVPDMTCNNCVAHVKKAVESVDGVDRARIDLATKKVELVHTDQLDLSLVFEAIRDAGYEPKTT
ncbi:MAG: permease [candidate division KSB1 bacterium]|nr:permease [candidate division KSB1 bacterium]MDZ7345875.1 permease [candidate division KSB1 bacterium]